MPPEFILVLSHVLHITDLFCVLVCVVYLKRSSYVSYYHRKIFDHPDQNQDEAVLLNGDHTVASESEIVLPSNQIETENEEMDVQAKGQVGNLQSHRSVLSNWVILRKIRFYMLGTFLIFWVSIIPLISFVEVMDREQLKRDECSKYR